NILLKGYACYRNHFAVFLQEVCQGIKMPLSPSPAPGAGRKKNLSWSVYAPLLRAIYCVLVVTLRFTAVDLTGAVLDHIGAILYHQAIGLGLA
ncbi:MAG: hypothetical protein PWQ18_1482, partial [Clostridia bacterium]|nr:hypothetical protein [Clostridia bacterium]